MGLNRWIVEANVEQSIGDTTDIVLFACASRQTKDALMLGAKRDQVDHFQIAPLHKRSGELASLRKRNETESIF